MNNHPFQKVALCWLVTILLIGCTKENKIDQSTDITCEAVTINVSNNLEEDITDLFLNEVNIGTLKAGETYNNLCLDRLDLFNENSPILTLAGVYKGSVVTDNPYYILAPQYTKYTGTYDIELTNIVDVHIFYAVK